MTDVLVDLRQTLRSLWRDRHFSVLAVLMLSVGIACTATIFSIVDAVLLRPLPLPEPDRLVQVLERTPEGAEFTTSEPNFLDFQAQQRSFVALGAYLDRAFDLLGQAQPERVSGAAVSASFFEAMRVAPQLGRPFSKDEDAPRTGQRVVVVSDAFWRSKLNAATTVLGQSILLNGTPHVVVGVMPPDFNFPSAALWVPLRADPGSDRGNHWLTMVGRLSPGATAQSAQRDLASVAERIGTVFPEARGWSVQVEALHHALLGTGMRTGLWTLMVAVTLFLLLTCANIANLFMTRVSARSEELAVRAALGAGKRRLVLHLLMEALVLSAVSGILTLLVTVWSLDGVRKVAQGRFPALTGVQIDLRLLAFTMLASVAAALLFSLLPSLRAGGQELHTLLKAGVRGGARRQSQRTRELLLVTQVGLATVLLLGSGLVLRSLVALQRVHPGFTADSLLAVPIELTGQRYQMEDWRQSVFFQQLEERVKQIPGVLAAGANTTDPFGPMHFVNGVTPVERAAEVGRAELMRADWRLVTRGYFQAARVPLLQGRLFGPEDRYDAPRVAVITAELARRVWPQQNAVGRSFYWGSVGGDPITVIGVVGDIRDFELAMDAPPMLFLPTTQMSMPGMTLLVRASGSPDALARSIRSAVWAIDPTVPVPTVKLVASNRSDALARPRIQALLMSSFGALALLVAALGVYALVSFQVATRRRELGIRCALGAHPNLLTRLLLMRTLLLVGLGLLAGSVLTVPLTGVVRVLLFQTAPLDPRTFLGVGLVLSAAALLAAYLPARSITRMDPLIALRSE